MNSLPGYGGVFNPINVALYGYAGLSPIKFVDPDGRELEISGTAAFISQAEADIKKLAPSAHVDPSTGKVTVSFWSRVKAYLTFDTGTKLVASVAASKKKTTTVEGPGLGNEAKPASMADATSGKGSDTTINYDAIQNPQVHVLLPNGKVAPKQEIIPQFIVLGHELIHALHVGQGNVNLNMVTHTYTDANGVKVNNTWIREEFRTSGIKGFADWFGPSENRLRQQHNLPLRATY